MRTVSRVAAGFAGEPWEPELHLFETSDTQDAELSAQAARLLSGELLDEEPWSADEEEAA